MRPIYGNAQQEWDRLDIPLCQIEFASTLAIIDGLGNEAAAIAKRDTKLFEQVIAFGVLTSKLPQYRRVTDHLLLVGRA